MHTMPDELKFATQQMAKLSPAELARKRADFFKFWSVRAKELIPEENNMRAKMDPVVSKAVKHKRLALFAEMLDFYNYPDKQVVSELVDGADLVGDVATTDMLPLKFTPALVTVGALKHQSQLRRARIESDQRGSGDVEIDAEVWRQTLEERDKGWLVGPLPANEIPSDTPVSRRFGLRQRHKVRLIDDFSESSVNQAVTVYETPILHTVDIAASTLLFWLRTCKEIGRSASLRIRTFDLSSAYRQIALSPAGRNVAYIRVYCPETQTWAYFQAQVLPFGAVKSVHSFLRVARAIWWLGTVACHLVWSSFYDDYILLSTPELTRSSEITAAALFELLGWDYAKEGRKCVPFSSQCEALGVLFDLEDSSKGVCRIYNTESRIAEISDEIEKVIQAGALTQTDAQKLRGRLQFAEAQIYGRTGRRCIRTLKEAACRRYTKLEEHQVLALRLFVKLMQSGKPRTLCWDTKAPIVIFTDACYERDSRDLVCGLGGVFIDQQTGSKRFFSCSLDNTQREILGELSKLQIIFEAETLCGVLAYLLWIKELEQRSSTLYVDNEGTKFCLMKGFSENHTVNALCGIFAELEVSVEARCWLARVPSHSNIADDPSRGQIHTLLALGYNDDSFLAIAALKQLFAFVEKKMGQRGECVVEIPT